MDKEIGKTDNVNDITYLCNTPVVSKDYDISALAIEKMVNDENVRNIGVVAPYGAGKSSLIKTYVDNNSKKQNSKKKIVEISLLHLSNNNKKATDSSNDSLLEKSILEQLFFREEKRKFPSSKIDRIHNRLWTSLFFSFALSLFLVLGTLTFLSFNEYAPLSYGYNRWWLLCSSSCSLLLLLWIGVYMMRIAKVSIQNIEVEFAKNDNESILNKFLDELIYYFKKTSIDVVIFEDLDRYGSVSLFTKLRDVNRILNNNNRIKHKITFIYCVSDDFFLLKEDRAKFFDVVISIAPYLNPKNSAELIDNAILDKRLKLNPIFLKRIAHFVSDKRILNNIVNDYVYYWYHIGDKKLEKEKLFAMMMYKNICFDDYVKLLKRKGVLYSLFNETKHNIISKIEEEKKNELNEVNKEIEKLSELSVVVSNIDKLKNMVFGMLVRYGKTTNNIPPGFVDLNSLKSFKNIQGGVYVPVSAVINTAYYSTQNGTTYKSLTIEELNSKVDGGIYRLENNILSYYSKDLTEKKNKLMKQIRDIHGMKMRDIIHEKDVVSTNNLSLDEGGFFSFAVSNGYIDEAYSIYIGHIDSNVDSLFIKNVLSGIPTNPEQILDNAMLVIEELDENDFSTKYVFNYSLIDALFTSDNISKQEAFIDYLSSRSDDTISFIKNYLYFGSAFNVLFEKLVSKGEYAVYDLLVNQELNNSDKWRIIRYLLNNFQPKDISILNKENVITNYIEISENPIENMLPCFKSIDSFISALEVLGIKRIRYLDYIDKKPFSDAFNTIVSKTLFDINYHNIMAIETNLLSNSNTNVSSLLNKSFISSQYFLNNLELTVEEVAKNTSQIKEDLSTIKLVLCDKNISDDVKDSFIRIIADEVPFDNEYNIFVCTSLVKNNKLRKNWEDLHKTFEKASIDMEALGLYVVSNDAQLSGIIDNKNMLISLVRYFESHLDSVEVISQVASASKENLLQVVDFNNDVICKVFIDNRKIKITQDTIAKCNGKIESIISALVIDERLINSINKVILTVEDLVSVINSDRLNLEAKKRILLANEKLIADSVDENNAEVFARFLLELESLPFNIKTTMFIESKIKDEQLIIDFNKLCLSLLDGLNLITYIDQHNHSLLERLLNHQNGKVYVNTEDYENDAFLGAFLKRNIVSKIKHSKNTTSLDVQKLVELKSKV